MKLKTKAEDIDWNNMSLKDLAFSLLYICFQALGRFMGIIVMPWVIVYSALLAVTYLFTLVSYDLPYEYMRNAGGQSLFNIVLFPLIWYLGSKFWRLWWQKRLQVKSEAEGKRARAKIDAIIKK